MASLALNCGSGLEEDVRRHQSGATSETPRNRRQRLRRRRDRRRASLVGSLRIAAVCVAMVCVALYGPNLHKLRQIRAEISDIQAQIAEWELRNLDVMARVEYARSDAFVRQAARERLGLVDQGTILYLAQVPGAGATGLAAGNQDPRTDSQSFAMSPLNSP